MRFLIILPFPSKFPWNGLLIISDWFKIIFFFRDLSFVSIQNGGANFFSSIQDGMDGQFDRDFLNFHFLGWKVLGQRI